MTQISQMPEMVERPPTRPLLRYHGGKWKLAPWIISHFPKHRIYVEPFGGGASVLLRKPRSYAEIYNDLDGAVVNLFRVARDHGDELVRVLELTPFAREEFTLSALDVDEPIERARRLVARSFMGFGSNSINLGICSGFRPGSKRSGTTPMGDWRKYPAALQLIIERLRGVCVENRDAAAVMTAHDGPQTLHYVDPPYPHGTRMKGASRKGYTHEMTDDDHRALAGVLNSLKGMVVLSGYPCALYDEELYGDWQRHERAAHADGARDRVEVLWTRNIQAERLLL